jgi:hypothetical protein
MHCHLQSRATLVVVGPMARSFVRTAFYLNAGVVIWAVNFLVTYVLAAIACTRGFQHSTIAGFSAVPLAVLIASAAAFAATALVLRHAVTRCHHQDGERVPTAPEPRSAESAGAERSSMNTESFIHFIAGAVAALSLIAIALNGFAASAFDGCRAPGAPPQRQTHQAESSHPEQRVAVHGEP